MENFRPFVYGLIDPLEPGHVRYVGMASVRASRPNEHAYLARKGSNGNPHLMNWIRKIQSEGREPTFLVLEQLSEGATKKFLGFVEQLSAAIKADWARRKTLKEANEPPLFDENPDAV